ncbi:MAG: FAD-binding oxidoreductase [Burkholderiales bacterium]|nr:MAG: FAD-binding oxidoreductase [Burkholderiales bacterium]
MDLTTLRAAFAGRLFTEPTDMAPYLTDWRRKWTGQALAVAQPDSAADVAAVVRWCHDHRVPVVPQGGNTGLSGGATPDGSGRALVLSLTRLNKVRRIDAVNNTIEVEAGVTLLQVQEAAREAERLFPLSLAAEGSCTIGGNLASNAGGVQVLRYGNARDLCLGLEVVTASGDLWDGLRGLRKDNTGYSLRDLYIGSEGTLGVITAATLKLFPLPAAQVVAFVAVPSPAAAVALLQQAQAQLGAALTACELMSDTCIGLVEKHVESARLPLDQRSPWYLLIEVSDTQSEAHANEALESLMEQAFEHEWATDAVVSQSLSQFQALWALREDISESQGAEGKTIKHDIALPISAIADFIERTDAQLANAFPVQRLVVFGHVGDGNLHYNLSPAEGDTDSARFTALEEPVNRLVHDAVNAFDGSISAEHGLGVLRRDESARYKSSAELALMRAVKQALDPHNLMNPGKVLP